MGHWPGRLQQPATASPPTAPVPPITTAFSPSDVVMAILRRETTPSGWSPPPPAKLPVYPCDKAQTPCETGSSDILRSRVDRWPTKHHHTVYCHVSANSAPSRQHLAIYQPTSYLSTKASAFCQKLGEGTACLDACRRPDGVMQEDVDRCTTTTNGHSMHCFRLAAVRKTNEQPD